MWLGGAGEGVINMSMCGTCRVFSPRLIHLSPLRVILSLPPLRCLKVKAPLPPNPTHASAAVANARHSSSTTWLYHNGYIVWRCIVRGMHVNMRRMERRRYRWRRRRISI